MGARLRIIANALIDVGRGIASKACESPLGYSSIDRRRNDRTKSSPSARQDCRDLPILAFLDAQCSKLPAQNALTLTSPVTGYIHFMRPPTTWSLIRGRPGKRALLFFGCPDG
jgi:hypothetical protein